VIQCSIQSTNSLSCDQTVGFAPAIEAAGAPVDKWFLKCTLGNINIGGTWLPMALTAIIIVIFIPLSPDVTLPSYSIPLAQIILGGTSTAELPVLSKLQILSEIKLCLDKSFFKFSKNAFTFHN